jgi:hypothetical protein
MKKYTKETYLEIAAHCNRWTWDLTISLGDHPEVPEFYNDFFLTKIQDKNFTRLESYKNHAFLVCQCALEKAGL